jgi:hypothetical protein
MDKIAHVANDHYNNDLRGGEGHMEVGKLIQNVVMSKAHMTLSVKPFGCMPSAGVSDGVQSLITEKYPGTIFCAVETSGDGRVNFYSRVQMYLFKAKAAAIAELERVCKEQGVSVEQARAFLDAHPRFSAALHKSPHAAAGSAADLVCEIAPLITTTRVERSVNKAKSAARVGAKVLRQSPQALAATATRAAGKAQEIAGWLKEDIRTYRATRAARTTSATA